MSRSNNTDLINPANRFFKWAGSDGSIVYYDKESKQNVNVPVPFRFLILDRVSEITGGIENHGNYEGFWSNAVKNLTIQPFTVRSKSGVVVHGLYEQVKTHPGVRFATGLYIAYHDENKQLVIGHLKLYGAALTAWIEFTHAHRNIYSGSFAIVGREPRTKGATKYFEPVFKFYSEVTPDTEKSAVELDEHLQEYLSTYFAQKGIEEVEQEFTKSMDANDDPFPASFPMTTGEPPEDNDPPF